MELKYITGCIAQSLTIDGKQEIDLNNNERLKVIDAIHKWLREHPEYLNELIQYLTSNFGNLEMSDTPCGCCGDFIDEYVLEL